MKTVHYIFGLSVLLVVAAGCNNQGRNDQSSVEDKTVAGVENAQDIKPVYLTAESFREKVWDYEKNPDQWVYEGDLPCIVDFYADWCKPCKRVAPIMDTLADVYEGKVLV
jgi:thiol-disulfide isomerase/thioredoxin